MSRFTLRNRKGGFTLIEIMIVVLIIGILLAIAVPNFMKARESSRTKSCIANLKQLESAKEQWAMDSVPPKAGTAVPATDEICGAGLYIKTAPTCPGNGAAYVLSSVDTTQACPNIATMPTHVLP